MSDDPRRGFRALFLATFSFFLVYVAIHVALNLSAQGTRSPTSAPAHQTAGPASYVGGSSVGDTSSEKKPSLSPEKLFIINLSGPITISICSSLLILSYGSFLLHGLRHLSVSAPNAFLKAFVIFIVGQIVVQITGHLEIAVTNYTLATDHHPPWQLSVPSTFSYTAAFFALFVLENYEARVFTALKDQIPEEEVRHGHDARTMGYMTIGSIALLVAKLVIVLLDSASKFGIVLLLLAAELSIAATVVLHLRRRSLRPHSVSTGNVE